MSIKQNGGVFGRNPTFNDVTIEGQLTFDGDIDINSDLKIDGDLDVTGTATVDELIVDGAVQVTSNTAFSGALTGRMFKMGTNGLTLQGVTGSQNDFIVTTPAGQILIANPTGTNDLALLPTTSGNVSIGTGNLVIGTSGKGIDFSATSGTGTSELFDDYEEGEWSPVVRDDSSAGNTGGGTIKGFYTKIGRNVFINFSVSNLTTTGMTSGNDLFITGLPYTPATVSGTNYYTGALVMHSVTTAGNQAVAIQDATNYIKLYETVSGAAFEFITVGDISSGTSDIRFSLTYEAA